MNAKRKHDLTVAINSDLPLEAIVALLRQYKEQGVTRGEVYSYLETLHQVAPDEITDDRTLEVADFVAGFCATHMKIWDGEMP